MTLSLNFRQSAYAQQTGNFPIVLLTIDHDDFGSPIRLSTDPTERLVEDGNTIVYGTTSNSIDYYFFPCELKLPDDTDDGPGQMTLSFSNVTRDYVATIRAIAGKPTVNAIMVMSDDVDTTEAQWPEFFISNVSYDASVIEVTMDMETLEREPYPYCVYSPNYFPGLFRSL